MLRHCVFVKFKTAVGGAERQAIYDQLAALRGHLVGIEAMSFGPNVSPEGLGQGFADGFVVDFRDVVSRDAYLVDPTHQAAGGRLVAALQGGRDGLVVFDIVV